MPDPMDEPQRLARSGASLLPVVGGLLFVTLCLVHRNFWLDDSFITFRYARNLALGNGPVFNPGEAVEGYTNFLWMLATSLSFLLLDEARALLAIKAAGLGLGLFTLWRCFTFPAPSGPAPGGGDRPRLLIVLLAANPVFVANCTDGLETPLFMALLVESARAFVALPSLRKPSARKSSSNQPSSRTAFRVGARLGLLSAAAVWTRPEALPLLAVWPALWIFCRAGEPGRRDGLGRALGGFWSVSLPLVLGHVAWRLAYYGAPLPNTFYAKATGELGPRLADGGADLGTFVLLGVGVPPLDVWLAGILAVIGSQRLLRSATPAVRAWLLALWLLVLFRVAFDVWSGSQFMGMFRFLSPALPLLFVLADEGARRVIETASRTRARSLVAACAVALAVAVFGNLRLAEIRGRYEQGLEQAHIALGEWLRATYPPGTRVALGDAGAIPFYSRLPVIDLWGLADATISRLPGEYGDRPGTADYVLGERPAIIVLWNLEPIASHGGRLRLEPAQPFDREIAGHEEFHRSYRFVREFTFRSEARAKDGYYLEVFEHRPGASARPAS